MFVSNVACQLSLEFFLLFVQNSRDDLIRILVYFIFANLNSILLFYYKSKLTYTNKLDFILCHFTLRNLYFFRSLRLYLLIFFWNIITNYIFLYLYLVFGCFTSTFIVRIHLFCYRSTFLILCIIGFAFWHFGPVVYHLFYMFVPSVFDFTYIYVK